MTDVREWLDSLGLGQFGDAFAENAIDWELLPELNHELLEAIGISAVGHRMRILKAAANLAPQQIESELRDAAPSASQAPSLPMPSGEAERRQLTVMFCDLVGSTRLAEQMDAEEYREILTAYQSAVSPAILKFEGYIARYMGDGLLVYFGFPLAHEDDAERAVRAGLEAVAAIKALQLPQNLELQVRIGIATGLVVVGDIVGEGASEERVVLGETPNLAARLQGIASGNCVVLSQSTERLVGGRFEIEPLGLETLKGISIAVPAFRAVSVHESVNRFDAAHEGNLSSLTGRASELSLLLERWDRACESEGQVVLLEGEPGIGKSRLIQAARDSIGEGAAVVQRLQCSSYHGGTAFHPIIDLLERATGISRNDDVKEKLSKLEQSMSNLRPGAQNALTLMASLLSLPTDHYPALAMTPQKQRVETIRCLVNQFEALVQSGGPLLMLLEDAHWADPSTIEVLTAIIDRIQALPVLLVITFRPEFEPPWTGYGHVTRSSLNRLGREAGAQIVRELMQSESLSRAVLEQILIKTDGVPLFIEELTKSVIEARAARRNAPLQPAAIPATLHDSLMARLDRLGDAKEVAQIAACIGREFSLELLQAVSDIRDNELRTALTRLVEQQIVFDRGNELFAFKHALVQDVAYESLLKHQRQSQHQRIARTIESAFSSVAESEPEILAHHYKMAKRPDEAIVYLLEAARRASARSADSETIIHVSAALEMIGELSDGTRRDKLELNLLTELCRATIAAVGHAAPELERALTRAIALGERGGDLSKLLPVLYAQMVFLFVSQSLPKSRDFTESCARLSWVKDDALAQMVFARQQVIYPLMTGDPELAFERSERALALYEPALHATMAYTFGQDARIATLAWLVIPSWYTGAIDEANHRARESLAEARELGHANTLAQTLSFASGLLPVLCLDHQLLEAGVRELKAHLKEHQLPFWENFARALQGRLLFSQGRNDEAAALLRQADTEYQAQGVIRWRPLFLIWLAEAYSAHEERDLAESTLTSAHRLIDDYGECWYESELYRVRAELLMEDLSGARDDVVTLFQDALRCARQTQAKSLELRAALGLARMWAEDDEPTKARAALAPVYDSFTEGHSTHDLQAAKTLLQAL
jgi:predicted ATPase/class 3 adenylate cyclase